MKSIAQVDLINEVSMNKQLMKLQRLNMFNPGLLSVAVTMESVEKWTMDKLDVDANGIAVGVNDELGTGQQRMEALRKLQAVINAPELQQYADKGVYWPTIDMELIDLLGRVKARRFMVCVYHMNQTIPGYMTHLLKVVMNSAPENMSAHILKSRLERLNQLNLLYSLFSKESVEAVKSVLAKISERN